MTRKHLKVWRAFCEWLNEQKWKSAYASEVPSQWRHLVYIGGNPTGRAAHDLRVKAKLIFYNPGWGWRLRKNWRERLEELEQGTPAISEQG
jgi:hypothetical protein